MVKPLILVTMGTNDYPFNRLYNYIKQDPLFKSDSCDWFIQYGACELADKPQSGQVHQLIPRADMEALIKRAALVISHCGIGSLNLVLQYRKQVIFVPRVQKHGEFSDDHQLQIASKITNRRMKVVMPGDKFPALDLEQIKAEAPQTEPVDITNYDLARIINYKLTA